MAIDPKTPLSTNWALGLLAFGSVTDLLIDVKNSVQRKLSARDIEPSVGTLIGGD